MSSTGYSGYSSFRVYFTIPSTTANGVLTMLSPCDTSNTLLTCQVISASSSTFQAQFNYASTGTATITYLEVNLYATANNLFGTAAAYTATVYLPQHISAINYYAPFGDTGYGSVSTYCSCQSSFTVGITPYGNVSTFTNLTFNAAQKSTRSKLSFIFGANSYRDAFFSSSYYQFSLGFLYSPCYTPYYVWGNFRCMVFQGPNSSSMTLSSSWKSLSLSNFASVILTPKA